MSCRPVPPSTVSTPKRSCWTPVSSGTRSSSTSRTGRFCNRADPSRLQLGAAADAARSVDVALEQQFALGLRQAAPNSVWLTDVQGVRTALGQHRAGAAHLLGPTLPLQTGPTALTVWVEKHRRIHAAA